MIPIYSSYSTGRWGKLLTLMLLFIIIGCSLDDKITGTVDETDTGIVAMLYNPDGSPAVGATIKIFKVTDTTKTPASEVISDVNGTYSLGGLAKGAYNVYAVKGELVAFQDSINVLKDTVIIEDDTLETPTNISGIVGLQANHDPQTVTVQVLGTDIYSNVNEDGYFTLNRMAKGDFTLKLSTIQQNYTTRYENLTIDADTPDTLSDTLWLKYTGIPVVEGLTATYDTLDGVVTLSWRGTKYRDFQDYLIYRDYFDSLNMSSKPIAFTDDTVFYDSIFDKSKTSGTLSFSDTNDYHFKYRVTVRNNSQEDGLSYKYVGVVAASTQKVRTFISYRAYVTEKQEFLDSASINDSIEFYVNISNMNRNVSRVEYVDIKGDSIVSSVLIDSANQYSDTIRFAWDSIGEKKFIIVCVDAADVSWEDTVSFKVVVDAPEVSATYTDARANGKIELRGDGSDGFGEIKHWYWSIGDNDAFIEVEDGDTNIGAPSTSSLLSYTLKAVDDDNNEVFDTVNIFVKDYNNGMAFIPTYNKLSYDLWMDTVEVTQGEYSYIMGNNPSYNNSGDDYPVEMVSIYDAIRYCIKKSALENLANCFDTLNGWVMDTTIIGYRLPTGEERCIATARLGTTTFYWGADTIDSKYAWWAGNSSNQTHPVAQKIPNSYGLYDVVGNVLERTYYYNYFGAANGGAYWSSSIDNGGCDSEPGSESQEYDTGFRCVITKIRE
jgi:hypothetical protein